ncbi:nucleolus and neural progenitor protein [Turdus rufiventris]|nr:nucleolus and neural progenitor protein [Turdus rufiventris]
MAAPRAAWDGWDMPWNRLDVPWPANSATVPLAAQHPAVRLLSALRRQCDIAGKRLSGPGLAAEGHVLRSVLYAYHSRLLRHRPYLALQQVEQCLKRLWKMNLVGCLETLVELIPKIQYRCVLETLMSLYSALSPVLHLVSETQQTPYIKEFTFPSDIGDFLGADISSEAKKQKAKMLTTKKSTSWMKKLFPAMPEAVSKVGKKRKSETCTSAVKKHSILCTMDIGETVVVPTARRGKHPEFDVKSWLRPARHPPREGLSIASTPFKAKSSPLSSRIAKSQHTGSLVQMVQTAASFGELSEALRKAILWCKNNKFKSEAYFLRNKLLKSNRLHHVEAQGCSLKKKLCCVKTSVRKYLLYGSQHVRWPRQQLWARFCRRRIRSSELLKTGLKTGGQKPPELFGVCENSASLILPAYQDRSPSQEEHSSIVARHVRQSTTGTPKQLLLEGSPCPVWKEAAENTDIDSIFATIGV